MCNGGAGICTQSSGLLISHNIFSNNSSYGGVCGGGAIKCGEGTPLIFNNVIINNSTENSSGGGGGILCSGDAKIYNNIITNNLVTGYSGGGGGIYCNYYDESIICNNIIANNAVMNSNDGGGAIYFKHSSINLFMNNTIVNNSTQGHGGAIYCYQEALPRFYNCILYGNTAAIGGDQVFINDEQSDPDFINCDVEGGSDAFDLNGNFYTGIYQNNIDNDPMFVSPSAGSGIGYNGANADWTLQGESPCINAGTPDTTGLNLPPVDLAGNPRILNGCIDIGAYESLFVSIKNESTAYSIKIYPNPASKDLYINSENGERISEVSIFNQIGQIVLHERQLHQKVDVSSLPHGIFILEIISGELMFRKKLVIE